MKTICKWVHGQDGALVMQWARADDSAVEREDSEVREADGFEAIYAFVELRVDFDALTSVGV